MNEQVFDAGRSRQLLPEGLDDTAPGPQLSAVLAELDHTRLNGHDLVRVIRAQQRQVAYEQARLYAAVAEDGALPRRPPR